MRKTNYQTFNEKIKRLTPLLSMVLFCFFFFVLANNTVAQTSKEYTAAEASDLVSDIEAGTYDEYILSSSGETYVVSDIDLASNVVVKAKEGLAAKPIFADVDNTGTYRAFFDVQSGAYSLTVQGIVFDGTATEPMIGVARLRADDANVSISDCEVKNFTTNNGIVRLDNAGTAITVDNTFVHDCYGRLIRINNDGSVYGAINITNSTFANITDDPVIHWVTSTASTVAEINIDQCTFYNVNDHAFKLGDLTGDLTVTNTIFDLIASSLSFEVPGSADAISYSYVDGFGSSVPTEVAVSNSITTAPVYTDAANLDLSLENAGMLPGMSGDPIGDPRWAPSQVSTTVIYDEQSVTNAVDQSVQLMSNKPDGEVYIILDGEPQTTIAEFETAVAANKGAKSAVTEANIDIDVSTAGLMAGIYYGYAVDGTDDVSEKGINTITVLEENAPVQVSNQVQTVTNADGQVAKVQSNKPEGTVYIVHEDAAQATLAELNAAIEANMADSATVTANDTDMDVPTDSLMLGDYYAYAVDVDGNLSDKGTNAITVIKGAPEVYALAQTVTDGADQMVYVQSSDDHGMVYIILDGVAQSTVAELEAAVAAGNGASAEVTAPLTDVALSTTGLNVGVYYAYAVDSVDNISAKGDNKLTVLSSTAPFKEYTVDQVDLLEDDISSGLYEIYILATSGGVYDFASYPDISKSMTIMGKPGLAEKPVVRYTANPANYLGIFRVRNAEEDVELTFENLEFNLAADIDLNALRADSKTHLTVRNCYIHGGTNNNGVFRLSAAGCSVDMEDCLITNNYRRVINFYNNGDVYGDVTIKNTTVSDLDDGGVVYFRSSGGVYAEGNNVTIDHCTFDSIGNDLLYYDKSLIAGTVSVTNSILNEIVDTINVDVLDYNYLNVPDLPADAGTNTFTTEPLFADSPNYDYTITNSSELICGDGEIVGDLNWYKTAPAAVAILFPQTSTNLAGDVLKAQSSIATGTLYLIHENDTIETVAELNTAVDENRGDSVTITDAFTDHLIPVTGLKGGAYYAYVLTTDGEISPRSDYSATVLDWLNIQYEEQEVSNGVGKTVTVTTSVDATAYVVIDGTYETVGDLEAAITANQGAKATATGETPVEVLVEGLTPGTYYGYAVADGNVSMQGENMIIITTSVFVDYQAQTAANNDGPWSHAYVMAGTAESSVYLLNDEYEYETVTEEVLEAAVLENMAAKDTILEPDVNVKVSTEGLVAGTYHFYLVKGGMVSDSVIPVVKVREPKVYYFSADEAEDMRASFYNASITTGDEVILTTSGGVYNFKTYFRVYGGVYIHAQEGLAEKPKLLYNPASGDEDVRSFMRLIEYYPPGGLLKIEGIELDGGANDELAGNSTFGIRIREDALFNYGYSLVFEDCYFHDFNTPNTNSSGVESVDGYVFRQGNNTYADSVIFSNCIIENTHNQAIYFRDVMSGDYFDQLKVTNTTFFNVPSVLNVSDPLEGSLSTIVFDHVTMDSIGIDTSIARLVTPDDLAYLTIQNSLVTNSGSQTAGDTLLMVSGNSQVINSNFYASADAIDNGGTLTDVTTLDPGYYDRDAFNYAVTHADLLAAGTDGLQLGDLRWAATDNLMVEAKMLYVSDNTLKLFFNQSVDTATAKVAANYTLSGTVGFTGNPTSVTMAGNNAVLVEVDNFADAIDFATIVVTVSNVTNVNGNAVQASANEAVYTIPIAITMEEQLVANEAGQTIAATCGSEGGLIYLVPSEEIILAISDLDALVEAGTARIDTVVEAMTDVEIDVEGIMPGMYVSYAVNANKTEWSNRSKNTATVRGLEVDMEIQLGKTNGPGETIIVQSTYNNATAYLVADSIDVTATADLLLAVENNDGVKTDVVAAFTDLALDIEGVNPGRYRAYVVSGDSISAESKVPVQIDKYVGINDNKHEVVIYAYDHTAYVKMAQMENAVVSIFNISGQMIQQQKVTSTVEEIELPTGLFIVKVKLTDTIITQKVFIK